MLLHVSYHWLFLGDGASGFASAIVDDTEGAPKSKEHFYELLETLKAGHPDGTEVVVIAWNEMG